MPARLHAHRVCLPACSDLPELGTLRNMLASKYGKEYAAEAAADATAAKWQVNHNLTRCLLVEAPQAEEKLAALSDIAQVRKRTHTRPVEPSSAPL